MRRLLKLVHLLSAAGLIGVLTVQLAVLQGQTATTEDQQAIVRGLLQIAHNYVLLPAVMLLLVSGLLALVAQPQFFQARWVWIKAALGAVLAGAVFFTLQPSLQRITQNATLGNPDELARLLLTERWTLVLSLLMAVAAVALGVWRPRWGRDAAAEADR